MNLTRQDGTTPLNLAAYADAKTALFLLDNGAKPDSNTNKNSPFPVPLVMSAARGDVELCARLIQAGSHPDELHPTEGFAPLHAAVSSEASRTEVIRLLLASGADVNLLRNANPIWSPLMYAATRGSVEHLQLLLGTYWPTYWPGCVQFCDCSRILFDCGCTTASLSTFTEDCHQQLTSMVYLPCPCSCWG